MMPINKFLHTSILVSDIKQAEFFYSNILCLTKSQNRNLNFPGAWYELGDYQIHLIENKEFTNNNNINSDKWGRNPHLAFVVENLAQTLEKLQDYGYPIQKSFSGRAALFTKDPDGNIIELVQNC